MTIVCGTDLSPAAVRAAHAAAAIAQRLATRLELVHVIDELGAEVAFAQNADAFTVVRASVRAEAEELHRRFEIEVEPIVVPGRAHDELVAIAREVKAELVVVAAVGRTQRHRWLLGSVAERVARFSTVPVLVIRDDAPITAWARGERTLDVTVGVDVSTTSRAAVLWAAGLRRIGPCDLQIVQLASTTHEPERLGLPARGSPVSRDTLPREVEDLLVRDLRAWVGELPGPGETIVEVHGSAGQVDWQVSQLAASADLLVVGAHQRTGIERVWHRSVSRGVLRHASSNIACVPGSASLLEPTMQPRPIQRVLVPTDLSPSANRALEVAYRLVAPGGVVHLMHVAGPGTPYLDRLKRSLRELVPPHPLHGVGTELHVVEADDPATAISQLAARIGVDLVCMSTHGRTGLSALVLGSHAQRVLQLARRPVLLVPPDRNE